MIDGMRLVAVFMSSAGKHASTSVPFVCEECSRMSVSKVHTAGLSKHFKNEESFRMADALLWVGFTASGKSAV